MRTTPKLIRTASRLRARLRARLLALPILLMAGLADARAGSGHEACFAAAARRYSVSRPLLMAIARQESSLNPQVVHRNADGSEDIGIMQINSSWFPLLARHGVQRRQLLDACVNIHVGAWILANNIRQYGPRWKAVGAYNARSADKQARYVAAIRRQLRQR